MPIVPIKYEPKTRREKIIYYGFIIAITLTIMAPLIYAVGQMSYQYGCFIPRTGYGYVAQHGDHWIWLAPQTDHELIMGNFTLAENVEIPEWVGEAFPTYYTISWGIITNINPY